MAFDVSISSNNKGASDLAAQAMVVVTEEIGQDTQWELQFELLPDGGDLPRLTDARLSPTAEVAIFAKNDLLGLTCLAVGPVEGQSIRILNGGEGSSFAVYGRSAEARMDQTEKVSVHQGLTSTDATIVAGIFASHTFVPDLDPTFMMRPPGGHPIVQRCTDLQLVRQLARRNGMHFWLSHKAAPVGPIATIAHFKKLEPSILPAVPELKINGGRDFLGAQKANISSLDISYDTVAPTKIEADGIDSGNGKAINGTAALPAMQGLGETPFEAIVPEQAMRLTSAADGAGDLTGMAEGVLSSAQFFIRASCEVAAKDVGPLHAHDTVRVTGAGSRHSGRYIVERVAHRFDDGGHIMDLTLVRNAWGEESFTPIPGI